MSNANTSTPPPSPFQPCPDCGQLVIVRIWVAPLGQLPTWEDCLAQSPITGLPHQCPGATPATSGHSRGR